MKRNIPPTNAELESAEKLGDDEEIEISDVRTVRKRRRSEPEAVATGASLPASPPGDVIDIDPETGEPYADDDDAAGNFPEGSIGAYILDHDDDEENEFEGQQCNIIVRRKPDSAGDRFAKPCSSHVKELPLRNIDLTLGRDEIEEMVRMQHLGGHYYLQPQIGTRFFKAWHCSLADPPDALQRMRANDPIDAVAAAPPPPTHNERKSDVDTFLETLEKQARMKKLLYGDEEQRLKEEIAELRAEVKAARENPAEPKSERVLLFEAARQEQDEGIRSRMLDRIFPGDDDKSRSWVADVADLAFTHADKLPVIFQSVGSLIGGILGVTPPAAAQPQQPQMSLEDLMKAQPPTLPTPPAGGFRRRPPATDSTPDAPQAEARPAESVSDDTPDSTPDVTETVPDPNDDDIPFGLSVVKMPETDKDVTKKPKRRSRTA